MGIVALHGGGNPDDSVWQYDITRCSHVTLALTVQFQFHFTFAVRTGPKSAHVIY